MKKEKKEQPTSCESCMFYDYDEAEEDYICTVSLDEDELLHFLEGGAKKCPFYRFYDEYKSVQRQN